MRAVLERDFFAEATRLRAFAVRAVPAVAVGAAMVAAAYATRGSWAANPDEVGLLVFRVSSLTFLGLLFLVAPPVITASLLVERLRHTLPLIVGSPVGPGGFARSMILSRVLFASLLCVGALPPLVLSLWFGGVTPGQVLGLAGVGLAVLLETAGWGFLVSLHTRRVATGIVLSYALPATRWLLGTVLAAATAAPAAALADSTPVGALRAVFDPGGFRYGVLERSLLHGPPGFPGAWPVASFLLVAALVVLFATLRVTRRLEDDAGEGDPEWVRRQSRWAVRIFGGMPRFANPITWKETRFLDSAASPALYYAVVGLLLSGVVSFLALAPFRSVHGHLAVLAGECTVVALVASLHGAASMGHEKAQGTLDLLILSRLPPERVVKGKADGVLLGTWLLVAVPVVHLLLVVGTSVVNIVVGIVAGFSLWILARASVLAGLVVGIREPRPGKAVTRVAAGAAVLVLGPVLGWAILRSIGAGLTGGRPGTVWAVLADGILGLSPPVALFAVLEITAQAGVQLRRVGIQAGPGLVFSAMAVTYLLLRLSFHFEERLPRMLLRRIEREVEAPPHRPRRPTGTRPSRGPSLRTRARWRGVLERRSLRREREMRALPLWRRPLGFVVRDLVSNRPQP